MFSFLRLQALGRTACSHAHEFRESWFGWDGREERRVHVLSTLSTKLVEVVKIWKLSME